MTTTILKSPFGGMNLSPNLLDSEVELALNVDPSVGYMASRPGRSGRVILAGNKYILGMYRFRYPNMMEPMIATLYSPQERNPYIRSRSALIMYCEAVTDGFYSWEGGNASAINDYHGKPILGGSGPYYSTTEVQFCQVGNILLFANGCDRLRMIWNSGGVWRTVNSFAPVAGAGTGEYLTDFPPLPKYIDLYNDQLIITGCKGYENRIWISDPVTSPVGAKPLMDFAIDKDSWIEFPFEVTAIKALEDEIVVFGKDRTASIRGVADLSWQLQSDKIGCVVANSIQRIGNTLVFLSEAGPATYIGGSVKLLLGDKARAMFEGGYEILFPTDLSHKNLLPRWGKIKQCASMYYPNSFQYWLAYTPIGSFFNTMVLVIDLRNSAFAIYTGINSFNCLLYDEGAFTGQPILISYTDTDIGTDNGIQTFPNGWQDGYGSDPPPKPIEFGIITKKYFDGDPNEKVIDSVAIEADRAGKNNLNFYIMGNHQSGYEAMFGRKLLRLTARTGVGVFTTDLKPSDVGIVPENHYDIFSTGSGMMISRGNRVVSCDNTLPIYGITFESDFNVPNWAQTQVYVCDAGSVNWHRIEAYKDGDTLLGGSTWGGGKWTPQSPILKQFRARGKDRGFRFGFFSKVKGVKSSVRSFSFTWSYTDKKRHPREIQPSPVPTAEQ